MTKIFIAEGDIMVVKKLIVTFSICLLIFIIINNIFVVNTKGAIKIAIPPFKEKTIDLYFIPHPDDETLSMGVAIANSVYEGNEVHLILFSKGSDSSARNIINGKELCNWHKKYHRHNQKKYKTLTCSKFGNLRLKEFVNASMDLGVPKRNIHICNFHNEKFNEIDIREVILKYQKKYPNARNNTTSFYDDHKTHKMIAKTVYRLYREDKIKDVKFYISPYKWKKTKGIVKSNFHINSRIIKSISDYSTWNPRKSCYAIGYHSVGTLFKLLREKLISKYYIPN